jgi:membrane fusion protein (multidrug efflux system)
LTAVKGIDVTAEVGGIVSGIFFESGQQVKKGDRLVQLDISTEEADLKNFEVQLGNAQVEFDRISKTASKGFTSKSELDTSRMRRDMFAASVARVKALIAQKTIYAPWDGRLGLKNIAVGKYIAAGQQLVWLQSLRSMPTSR